MRSNDAGFDRRSSAIRTRSAASDAGTADFGSCFSPLCGPRRKNVIGETYKP
jgi:hypothetical protein